MDDPLIAWETTARRQLGSRPGVLDHRRQTVTAAPEPPAARIIELTGALNVMQRDLGDACAEIRRLRAQPPRAVEQRERIYHSFDTTSFGGYPMAQHFCDLYLWECLLNTHTEARGIVEIGTWQGGFSWWLWAQSVARQMEFVTYDAVEPDRPVPGFQRRDVFAEADAIGEVIRRMEPVVLFCDNGNKPRELKVFPLFLQDPRSFVVVHDWGSETLPADVPENLVEVHGEFCDEIGSISRVFAVKR